MNTLLNTPPGEYIALYQSQRKALRLQFQQKDSFINKLLNERSTMQVMNALLCRFYTIKDIVGYVGNLIVTHKKTHVFQI